MAQERVITDYYGTEIKVQPLMASPGLMVDLEAVHKIDGSFVDRSWFYRLTPEQAIELGEWLIEASGVRVLLDDGMFVYCSGAFTYKMLRAEGMDCIRAMRFPTAAERHRRSA